jgi:hypothetical protein
MMFSLENEEAFKSTRPIYISDGQEYSVAPDGEHGFFSIKAKKGPVPGPIAGRYTSYQLAVQDFSRYLSLQARVVTIVPEPVIREPLKNKIEVREEKKVEKAKTEYGSEKLVNVS